MAVISGYALLGDCHSAALVSREGSIDWSCFPAFDSPSFFACILDTERGGHFSVAPVEGRFVGRQYLEDTNVLVTSFSAPGGELELTDCMPIGPLDPGRPTGVTGHSAVLRRARCTRGRVRVRAEVAARFEYGSFIPRFRLTSPTTCEVVGGGDALWVTSSHPLVANYEHVEGEWDLAAGEEAWVEVAWSTSFEERQAADHPGIAELAGRLERTIRFWRDWMAGCAYRGEHAGPVRRSALVLKALTYAPTGAVVAAPTTSLPEEIGGVRNWDYRYIWIRDSTLTLISLMILGFKGEADAYRFWIRRTSSGRPQDLQIMYGIRGNRSLPEIELGHLAGHRGSVPVRIGNGAVKQLQLDAYGQLLEAAWLYARIGGTISPTNWDYLRGLADIVCGNWRNPDQGIWEIRDRPRHFVHSKLLCWAALDRALCLAEMRSLPGDLDRWREERAALEAYLLADATSRGYFSQAVGRPETDASTLLVPAMGFLPPRHPLVLATIARVRAELEHDGFVHRYRNPDGLSGGEGAFLLCSLWLVDALAHGGEVGEAERILERIFGLANDVGLYAEEAIPGTGEALGNFPQAFTHMALVTSCVHVSAARAGELPEGAYDFAGFALERTLHDRRRG